MTLYKTSLFIFRRDLRIHDNTALNEALKYSKHVIPCFIFDPRQIQQHPYQSKPALEFMLQSIQDLQQQFQDIGGTLILFQGRPEQIIAQLKTQEAIQAVFINRDYTPFSRKRDFEIAETCKALDINLHYLADSLLTEPEQALKGNHQPYQMFTPFYNNAKQLPIALPQALVATRFTLPSLEPSMALTEVPIADFDSNASSSGRSQALAILNNLSHLQDYANIRDFPALNGTSQLSAHLKFGTCSVREVFYAITKHLGSEHPLRRQLYWRDFFTHIAYHFPQVFGHAFNEKFAALKWSDNKDYFDAWCQGKTGFPIIDAGMRQLNETGDMHNRVRMIAAAFLVKDLDINWRWGERYFAQHLRDYDPCVNNGNWQWAASTGCDAQPYFRIFNPWRQQQKFDPDCQYIFRWVPELRNTPVDSIHQWHKLHKASDYPAPIIDHQIASQQSKEKYKKAASERR